MESPRPKCRWPEWLFIADNVSRAARPRSRRCSRRRGRRGAGVEELKEELSIKGDAAVAAIRDESRRKFEKLGLARMRHALKQGITDSQGIANRTERVEAEAWIQQEEVRQQRRKWGHLWLLIGVVALLIAGAAVMVRDWMMAPP